MKKEYYRYFLLNKHTKKLWISPGWTSRKRALRGLKFIQEQVQSKTAYEDYIPVRCKITIEEKGI